MKKTCIVLTLFFLLSVPVCTLAKNYCSDPQARQEWAEFSAKHPKDDVAQTLHALWLGLCIKVKAGEIDEKQAIDLFEKAREAAIAAKKKEAEQEEKKKKADI